MLKFLEFIKENASEEPISIQIENLFYKLDDEKKREIQYILGKYLILDKKRNKVYSTDDIVLVEYWYNNMLTPVKILEKKGRSYDISHNIIDSKIKNAPNETVKNTAIVDYYYKQEKDENIYKIDPSVRLKNAIETLHPFIQNKLYNEIKNTINEEIKHDNVHIYGKNVFNSFLKVLSAINQSEKIKKLTTDCPKDFLYYYEIKDIDNTKLESVFKRFTSLKNIDISNNNGLFFGLNYKDGKILLSYGLLKNETQHNIGSFIVTTKDIQSISSFSNKYLKLFKEDMENVLHNTKHLKKLYKLKTDISTFSPDYYKEKTNPYISEDCLIIKFYGLGKWEASVMNTEDLNKIKNTFKEWANANKYKDVKFKAVASDFWVTFTIKF